MHVVTDLDRRKQQSLPKISQVKLDSGQKDRQDLMERMCKKYGHGQNRGLTKQMVSQLLVDEKRHIIWCSIPKVACTNWKRALGISSGRLTADDIDDMAKKFGLNPKRNPSKIVHTKEYLKSAGLQWLDEFTLKEIKQKISKYFKFLFVRDPHLRLLSTCMCPRD